MPLFPAIEEIAYSTSQVGVVGNFKALFKLWFRSVQAARPVGSLSIGKKNEQVKIFLFKLFFLVAAKSVYVRGKKKESNGVERRAVV